MFTDQEYTENARLGVAAARIHRDGGQLLCIPLSLLYVSMAERKEITTLTDLGQTQKLKYWTLACLKEPGASRAKKIWLMQAYYMIELIGKK